MLRHSKMSSTMLRCVWRQPIPATSDFDPLAPDVIAIKDPGAWEVTHSGNSVSLEQEMIKAGEVNRTYSLNTSIVKAFNQMLMASIKG